MKYTLLATAFIFSGFLSAPVYAEEAASSEPPAVVAEQAEKKQLQLNIQMDEQMKRAEENYRVATKDLTPAQLEQLKKLDADLAGTMDPDARIMHAAGKMEFCMNKNQAFRGEEDKHVAAFKKWRDDINADQEKLWDAHKVESAKIDFVPQDILDDHYNAQKKLNLQLIGGVVIAGRQAGAYAKTDCAAFAKEISGTAE